MKKRKSAAIGYMIAMAIGVILLLVVVYGMIKGILVNKQLAFAGEKTEEVTKDCDEDSTLGLNDKCPCVFTKQILGKDEKCGAPDAKATTNCPALCKK